MKNRYKIIQRNISMSSFYRIEYEPDPNNPHPQKWYEVQDNYLDIVFKKRFNTKQEARKWILRKERK